MTPGLGKYDHLYRSVPTYLWGGRASYFVRKNLLAGSRERVLDVGCGDGKNLAYLRTVATRMAMGIDISELALRAADRRIRQIPHVEFNAAPCHLARSDAARLPFQAYFDAVVSTGLFHCLDDAALPEAIESLARVALPSSVLLLATITSGLPMPQGHGTGPLFLRPSDSYVHELTSAWEVHAVEVTEIDDSHSPVIGAHKHEILRLVATRRA